MSSSRKSPAAILRRLKQSAPDGKGELPELEKRQEFTIDQLAREAGSTVRNVRAYQDRGLLPPPEKRGRTGIYTDVHLARLKIIGALLERGYTLNNIRDLLSAWEQGRDLNDILGLEVAVTSWQNPEVPSYKDYQDLIDDFGEDITPEVMTKAVSLGYMIPEGMRLRVPYPRIYNAGKELVENGVPLDAVLTHVRLVRQEVDKLAERFIDMIVEHLVDEKYGPNSLPEGEDVAGLAEFITRIRPLAEAVVNDELGRVLEKSINKVLVDRLENVLAHLEKHH
ncbi:MAG: MerR family transcriptional regulator [Alcanivorax sp.]|nr:MerR family transcriptional regulator [Alcanivorax sp.]